MDRRGGRSAPALLDDGREAGREAPPTAQPCSRPGRHGPWERGVLFRFGKLVGTRSPGLRLIIPFADVLHRVSLRIVTQPIQSQGIITQDNVSVDVSAVAYFRVVDAVKSVIAIENVDTAINQIAGAAEAAGPTAVPADLIKKLPGTALDGKLPSKAPDGTGSSG